MPKSSDPFSAALKLLHYGGRICGMSSSCGLQMQQKKVPSGGGCGRVRTWVRMAFLERGQLISWTEDPGRGTEGFLWLLGIEILGMTLSYASSFHYWRRRRCTKKVLWLSLQPLLFVFSYQMGLIAEENKSWLKDMNILLLIYFSVLKQRNKHTHVGNW